MNLWGELNRFGQMIQKFNILKRNDKFMFLENFNKYLFVKNFNC